MSFIVIIYILVVGSDLWWWKYLHRRAASRGLSRGWRRGINLLMGLTLFGVFMLIGARMLHLHIRVLPEAFVMWLFIWHIIVMPWLTLLSTSDEAIRGVRHVLFPKKAPVPIEARRKFLTSTIIVVPPVIAAAMTGHAIYTEDDLRIRRVELPLADLPPALDGMTIAQMTDPHLGSFISDRKYRNIIELTNSLDADLVLQTGDLINSALADLPDGIAMVRAMKGRYGTYCCEGNHDVMMSRPGFEEATQRADINMLLDEDRIITVRGQRLRLIGSRWTGYDDDYINWRMQQLVPKPITDVFTIMMAHYPHCFDPAAALGIPLTLSGHTHGGQLALTHDIGIGPMMYRYWSGLYRKGNSACFVSNGTGNWFPLRINVPCEIVHLTLRCAKPPTTRTTFQM